MLTHGSLDSASEGSPLIGRFEYTRLVAKDGPQPLRVGESQSQSHQATGTRPEDRDLIQGQRVYQGSGITGVPT
jgi:hypothetical protein